MSETITADHLNATHLGKKISILDNCEIVMSGKLKELRATQYSMPVYSNSLLDTLTRTNPSTVRS